MGRPPDWFTEVSISALLACDVVIHHDRGRKASSIIEERARVSGRVLVATWDTRLVSNPAVDGLLDFKRRQLQAASIAEDLELPTMDALGYLFSLCQSALGLPFGAALDLVREEPGSIQDITKKLLEKFPLRKVAEWRFGLGNKGQERLVPSRL